jgi:hypothetical protein
MIQSHWQEHASSISTLTANSSIYIQIPVDTFMSCDGASDARVRNNEVKEQEVNNEMDLPVKTCELFVKLTTLCNLLWASKGQH